jgi:type 1 fimbria pilin
MARSLKLLAGMVAGILPGLLVCALLVGGLKDTVRTAAAAETFLPQGDITLSGRVTEPTCISRLAEDRLVFDAVEKKPEKVLHLQLSACEAEDVGVALKSDYLPEMPERGVLLNTETRQPVSGGYFTVGPDTTEKDRDGKVRVYRLDQTQYWLGLDGQITDGGSVTLPFLVRMVPGEASGTATAVDARFTLQVSYR